MTDFIYAVMDADGIVANIVTGPDADSVEVLRLLLPDAADIILTTDATGPAYIGGDKFNGKFRLPQPYPSWTFDQKSWTWNAPVSYPENDALYVWDEEQGSWVAVLEPSEA